MMKRMGDLPTHSSLISESLSTVRMKTKLPVTGNFQKFQKFKDSKVFFWFISLAVKATDGPFPYIIQYGPFMKIPKKKQDRLLSLPAGILYTASNQFSTLPLKQNHYIYVQVILSNINICHSVFFLYWLHDLGDLGRNKPGNRT